MKRNYFQFSYGEDRDIVSLVYKPQFIKIQIFRQHKHWQNKLHQVCTSVRNLVKNTLKSVTSHMLQSLYTLASSEKQFQDNFEDYQFAFECYEHPESKHFCVVKNNEEDPTNMDCQKDNCYEKVLMQPMHRIWYGKVSYVSFLLYNNFIYGCLHRSLMYKNIPQKRVNVSFDSEVYTFKRYNL